MDGSGRKVEMRRSGRRGGWIERVELLIAIFCIMLVISTPLAQAQIITSGEEDTGESIIINVEDYQPKVVVSSVLEERKTPVYAYLKGATFGSLVGGSESPKGAPFYGIPKIKTMTITAKDSDSNKYLSGGPVYIKPQGNKYVSDGNFVDLGYLIITLRQMKEGEIPNRIDLNLSARIRFEMEYGMGEFGAEEIVLKEYPTLEEWKKNKMEGQFWGERGYVWATKIEDNKVSLKIYDSYLMSSFGSPVLSVGEVSSPMKAGGSNIYMDYFRVRLDGVDIPRDTAEVLLEVDGTLEKKMVAKGQRLFPGSEWYVEKITPGTVRTLTENGKQVSRTVDIIELRHKDGHTLQAYAQHVSEVKNPDGTTSSVKVEKEVDCTNTELLTDDELADVETKGYERLYCTAVAELKEFVEQYPGSTYNDEAYYNLGLLYEQNMDYEEALKAFQNSRLGDAAVSHSRVQKLVENSIKSEWVSLDIFDDNTILNAAKIGRDLESTSSIMIKLLGVTKVKKGNLASATMVIGGALPKTFTIGAGIKEEAYKDSKGEEFWWVVEEINSKSVGVRQDYSGSNKGKLVTIGIDKQTSIQANGDEKLDVRVTGINTNRVAKITILPGTGRAVSESEFSIHIPVEKRAFKLSPEQIESQMAETDKVIKKLDKAIEKIDKTLTAWKVVCMGTFATISLLNLFKGTEVGKAREYILHKKKIRIPGLTEEFNGWGDYCNKASGWGKTYSSYDACIFANSESINKEIKMAKGYFKSAGEIMSKKISDGGLKDAISDGEVNQKATDILLEKLKKEGTGDVGLVSDDKEKIRMVLSEGMSPNEVEELLFMKEASKTDENIKKELEERLKYYVDEGKKKIETTDKYNTIVRTQITAFLPEVSVEGKTPEQIIDGLTPEQKNTLMEKSRGEFDANFDVWKDRVKAGLNYEQAKSQEPVSIPEITQEMDKIISTKEKDSPKGEMTKEERKKWDEKKEEWGKITATEIIGIESAKVGDTDTYWMYDTTNKGVKVDLHPLEINGKAVTDSRGRTIYYNGNDIIKPEDRNPPENVKFYVPVYDFFGKEVVRNSYASDASAQFYDNGKPYCIPTKQTPSDKSGSGGNYIKVEYDGTKRMVSLWNVGSDGYLCGKKDSNGRDDDIQLMGYDLLVARSKDAKDSDSRLLNTLEREADKNVGNCNEKDSGKLLSFSGFRMRCGYDSARINANINKVHCTDVMGTGECRILFNVCDPVMCPASRFDLGGRWPLRNQQSVVETGIIGSLVLGLPNAIWNDGGTNVLPVCLTGISSGLKGWRSVFQAYKECLHTSQIEGETVGICDRIRSVFVCELFWKEAMAILDTNKGVAGMALDKIFGKRVGSSGGYEYTNPLDFRNKLDEIGKSAKYFAEDYAQSAFAAYESRSTSEIGTELCKTAIFGKAPGVGKFIEELAKPESPPQFTAFFDEVKWTDAYRTKDSVGGEYSTGEEGQSRYSVYYHIYAGEDTDIRYSVFMTDSPYAGEYTYGQNRIFITDCKYSSGSIRSVISKGDYVDKNCDFIAKSGMTQVCVEINGEVKCGFGKTSSDFGLNYLSDLMVEEEVDNKISSSEDCSTDTGAYTTLAGSLLTNTGIRRVCSLVNPGRGTNEDEWTMVGDCGKDEEGHYLGQCWLDKRSIDITDMAIMDETTGILGDRLKEYDPLYETKMNFINEKWKKLEAAYSAWITSMETIDESTQKRLMESASEYVAGYRDIISIGTSPEKSESSKQRITQIYNTLAQWGFKTIARTKAVKQAKENAGDGGKSGDGKGAGSGSDGADGEWGLCEVQYQTDTEIGDVKFSCKNGEWYGEWSGKSKKEEEIESGLDATTRAQGEEISRAVPLSELRGKISEFEEKNEGGGNVDEDELEIFTSNFFDIYQNLLQANCEEGIRYLVERVNSKENKEDILKISKEKDGKTTRMEVGYKNLDAPSVTNFCEGSIKNIACGSVYKRGSNTLTLQECHKMWGVRGEKDCYFARPAFKNNNCVNCAEITSCKNLNYDKEQCENTGCLELARYEEGISCKWDEKEKKCVATKCERLCEQNIFEKLWSVVAPSTKCNEDNCEKISGCDWEVDKCYDSASGSEEEENGGSEGDSGGSEKETGSKESGIKTNDEKGEGSRGDGGKSKSNSGSGGEKTNTATAEEELLETTGWEEVPLVCVDAGHNKDYNLFDTKSSSEAETNLAIAKKVESELKNKKYDVAMSRTGERRVTFPDDSDECDASFRAYFANSEGCNIGVSIHSDANNGGKGSAIVCDMARKKRRRSSECPENCKSLPREYCQKGDYEISNPAEKSKKLAEEVLNELSTIWEMYGMGNGGIRMDTSVERVKTGELSSIGGVCSAEMPYVLVEVADHTDSEQQTYLQQSSFQEKLAESIASGIDKYARENLRERA